MGPALWALNIRLKEATEGGQARASGRQEEAAPTPPRGLGAQTPTFSRHLLGRSPSSGKCPLQTFHSGSAPSGHPTSSSPVSMLLSWRPSRLHTQVSAPQPRCSRAPNSGGHLAFNGLYPERSLMPAG